MRRHSASCGGRTWSAGRAEDGCSRASGCRHGLPPGRARCAAGAPISPRRRAAGRARRDAPRRRSGRCGCGRSAGGRRCPRRCAGRGSAPSAPGTSRSPPGRESLRRRCRTWPAGLRAVSRLGRARESRSRSASPHAPDPSARIPGIAARDEGCWGFPRTRPAPGCGVRVGPPPGMRRPCCSLSLLRPPLRRGLSRTRRQGLSRRSECEVEIDAMASTASSRSTTRGAVVPASFKRGPSAVPRRHVRPCTAFEDSSPADGACFPVQRGTSNLCSH